jgi:hypothetical protein
MHTHVRGERERMRRASFRLSLPVVLETSTGITKTTTSTAVSPAEHVFRLSLHQGLPLSKTGILETTVQFTAVKAAHIFVEMGSDWASAYKCKAGKSYVVCVRRVNGLNSLRIREQNMEFETLRNARTPLENPVFVVRIPISDAFTDVQERLGDVT